MSSSSSMLSSLAAPSAPSSSSSSSSKPRGPKRKLEEKIFVDTDEAGVMKVARESQFIHLDQSHEVFEFDPDEFPGGYWVGLDKLCELTDTKSDQVSMKKFIAHLIKAKYFYVGKLEGTEEGYFLIDPELISLLNSYGTTESRALAASLTTFLSPSVSSLVFSAPTAPSEEVKAEAAVPIAPPSPRRPSIFDDMPPIPELPVASPSDLLGKSFKS